MMRRSGVGGGGGGEYASVVWNSIMSTGNNPINKSSRSRQPLFF
jgi:hypothetical protein